MKDVSFLFEPGSNPKGQIKTEQKEEHTLRAFTWLRLAIPHVIGFFLGRLVLAGVLAPFGPAFYAVYRYLGGYLSPLCGILVILGGAAHGRSDIVLYDAICIGICTILIKPGKDQRRYGLVDAIIPGVVIFVARLILILFGRQTLLVYFSAFIECILGSTGALLFHAALSDKPSIERGKWQYSENRAYAWLLTAVLVIGSLQGIGIGRISMDVLLAMAGTLVIGYLGGSEFGALFGLLAGTIISLTGSESAVIIGYLGTAGALSGVGALFGKVETMTGYLSAGLIMSFLEKSGPVISQRLLMQMISGLILLFVSEEHKDAFSRIFQRKVGEITKDDNLQQTMKMLKGKIASLSNALSEVSMLFQQASPTKLQVTPAEPSDSIDGQEYTGEKEIKELSRDLIKEIAERICGDCPSKKTCWEEDFGNTYDSFMNLARKTQLTGRVRPQDLADLYDKCERASEIAGEINHRKEIERLEMKLNLLNRETRECLFFQYRHLSEILDRALSLDDVRRESGTKSLLLQEPLDKSQKFKISLKGKTVTAGGQEKAGDMWVRYDLAPGKILVILADGMGKGSEAARQSQEAIGILKSLLDAGLDYDSCISFLNSGLYLAWRPERFLALDFLLIDVNSERVFFHKMGAPPSFIRRKDGNVIVVRGSTPPAGAAKTAVSLASSEPLLPGDLVVMVSDGVFRSSPVPSRAEHMLMMRLSRLKDPSLDNCIKTIISQSIRYPGQKPPDDVTVVAAEVSL